MTTDPRIERSRSAVLQAGADLLVTEGWGAVTHLRVADVAGVGRATTYRHWPTTGDLLEDVLRSIIEDRQPAVPTGELRHDLIVALTPLCEDLDQAGVRGALLTLMERADSSPRFASMLDAVTDAGQAPLRSIVAAGVARGDLAFRVDPEAALAALIGPLVHQRLLRRQPVGAGHIADVVDAFLEAHRAPSAS